MKIGICTTDFTARPVEALFDAVKAYGFSQVQFNFTSIGEDEIPEKIAPSLTDRILNAAGERQIEIAAVNGTFNMISPDIDERKRGTERFNTLADACSRLNCGIITLCTGTRDTGSMWKWHSGNTSVQAWEDLLETTELLITVAKKYRICLGVETEASNVVDSPELARKLLDEIRSPYLKIIMDCANLFQRNTAYPENVRGTIKKAFDLIGKDVVLAHGKDILASQEIEFTSTGKGIIDFDYFLELLKQYDYRGGMILHGIKKESDMPFCVDFIQKKISGNNMIV
jgi:sugar phosphate isomerase/epimerase